MIHYLVSKGADVKAVNREGQTTVDMANGPVQRMQPWPETIKFLERHRREEQPQVRVLLAGEDSRLAGCKFPVAVASSKRLICCNWPYHVLNW